MVRPIEPGDRDALAAAMRRLSPESRYRRFFTPRDELGEAELRYLTEVDHHDHEALVALEGELGEGVGVARYIRLEDDPETAEIAVAVADDWQGKGVGGLLLHRLSDAARDNGIGRFSAMIMDENRPMLALIEGVGDVKVTDHSPGAAQLLVELPPKGVGSSLRDLLRATARGDVIARPLNYARRLGPSE